MDLACLTIQKNFIIHNKCIKKKFRLWGHSNFTIKRTGRQFNRMSPGQKLYTTHSGLSTEEEGVCLSRLEHMSVTLRVK